MLSYIFNKLFNPTIVFVHIFTPNLVAKHFHYTCAHANKSSITNRYRYCVKVIETAHENGLEHLPSLIPFTPIATYQYHANT